MLDFVRYIGVQLVCNYLLPFMKIVTRDVARFLRNCPKCNQAKEENMLVCWDCWKRGDNPLKESNLSFEQWILIQ